MILELMQHRYLAESIDEAGLKIRECIASVEQADPTMLALLNTNGVTLDELRTALERAELAASRVAAPVEANATYFPRDSVSSQMQSVLQRYFLDHGLTQTRQAPGAVGGEHPISDVSLLPAVATKAPDQLFGTMSQTDAGWIACLAAKAYRAIATKHPFPGDPAAPKVIANDARIYLVGDWGSGIGRAKKIADRIESMLEAEGGRDQHVIHLGDVYYSGWPEEYDEHFLPNWPVKPGRESRCGSWALNSNHEMFSGGHGYFDHLLRDVRFSGQQGRSFFSLENADWQLLGLDSAWQDEDLAGRQFDWVEQRQAEKPGKKLVLMTHHQPFSAFEKDCVKLQRLLVRNRVTAWFWGHEHRFAMYKPRPDLKYGRLIGHGGVPVWARPKSKPVPEDVQYVSTSGFRSGIERFALFGFAVLDFDGPAIRVRYFDEHGAVEQAETIV